MKKRAKRKKERQRTHLTSVFFHAYMHICIYVNMYVCMYTICLYTPVYTPAPPHLFLQIVLQCLSKFGELVSYYKALPAQVVSQKEAMPLTLYQEWVCHAPYTKSGTDDRVYNVVSSEETPSAGEAECRRRCFRSPGTYSNAATSRAHSDVCGIHGVLELRAHE